MRVDCRLFLILAILTTSLYSRERTLTKEELEDKVTAFWHGQLVGNYMGFPFEGVFIEEPVPVLVDRIYTWADAGQIRLNDNDRRSFTPIVAEMFEGAFADDDTDIEFVTLHAVENMASTLRILRLHRCGKTISIEKSGWPIGPPET